MPCTVLNLHDCTLLASCSTSIIAKRPTITEQQTTDALTGLIISTPKKQRVAEGFEANATLAGYSPELSKALRSVVKIFTTMARYASWLGMNRWCCAVAGLQEGVGSSAP